MRQYFVSTFYTGQKSIVFEENGVVYSFLDPSEGNTHYYEYLAWLEEGNEPQPWDPKASK